MAISYIKNEDLDFKKWDKCIKKAFNGNIFAYSWYLNIVTENWDALVENDYESVMPLPQEKFWGQKIIRHPCLAGPLGIFTTKALDEYRIKSFLAEIPLEINYIKLKINKLNYIRDLYKKTGQEISMDLDLIKPYLNLKEKYPKKLHKYLEKAQNKQFKIQSNVNIDKILQLKQGLFSNFSLFGKGDLVTKQLLTVSAINNKQGQLCGIYDNQNCLLALAFFTWSHQKANLVYFTNTGKEPFHTVLFFLLDDFIRNNSEKNLILHFDIQRNSRLVSLLEKIGAKRSENFIYYRNFLPRYLKPFVKW